MPFKSKAQMAYMYANHPKIAERWQSKYKQKLSRLPKKAKKEKKS